MQDVHEPAAAADERGPVPPIKAFLILGALVAATIATVIVTRPETPQADPAPTALSIPTEAEAIQIFNKLHELWLRSYQERDATLIKLYAVPGSNLDNPDEINLLRREHVLDRTRFEQHSVSIRSIGATAIEVEQDVTVAPKLVDEITEQDRTVDGVTERRTVLWEIRLLQGTWLISSSTITAAETVQ